jgi:PhnB protein
MPKRSPADQFNTDIQAMLVQPGAGNLPPGQDPSLAPLLRIAQQLRDLPRENFKARLKSDLERKSSMASHAETATTVLQTATPRLRIKNAAAAIEFYKKAFGATETMRFEAGGAIAHAEIRIGNSVIMLGEEALDYGFPSPQTLGGSPVSIHLYVDDADALAQQAVSAGARLVAPVKDQFYGDRSGQVEDPFGYLWAIATRKEELTLEEMHRRLEQMEQQAVAKPAVNPAREGFRALTPYLIVQDAPGLIEFVKRTFAGEETFRAIGSAGGIHCEVRLGDSMLMIGGGGPGLSWRGESRPMAFHVYVKDTDAVYQGALEAGAVSLQEPADQPWGERTANVKDPSGNNWYIATFKGENYFSEGAPTVQPYLHPRRAAPVVDFLKRAFGAKELGRHTSPEGVVQHTTLKIGDAAMEMSEAEGRYQPMPSTFYLYVPDVDAAYRRALEAGATSTGEPADQPYGARGAGVKDAFGNQWYIAAQIKEKEVEP